MSDHTSSYPPPPPPPPPGQRGTIPRPLRRRAAVTALVLCVVGGAVVGVVIGLMLLRDAKRYLGDLFDTVEPPEASAEVGEWFTTDDGDLRIRVTSLECRLTEFDSVAGVDCTFTFDVENHSDHAVSLNDITVKSVVDGDWASADLFDPAEPADSYRTIGVEAGEERSLAGSVSPGDGTLDGLVFDANDASSHSAVVVDARPAWEQARPAPPDSGDEPTGQ